jgi:predicted CXXCH cytochrome family protein
MASRRGLLVASALAPLLLASPAAARVGASLHDFSAGAGVEPAPKDAAQTCRFCHTPHRARGKRGLWDRERQPVVYKLYESSTLRATPSQPTGASRLCLSCHDGTTARATTGAGAARPARGPARPAGRSLGADLSDDHPISFAYDTALAARHGELSDPGALPRDLRLDGARELQCTTCHDPHEQRFRKFLRVDDRGGALCVACHRPRNWAASSHATSRARLVGPASAPAGAPWATVAESACASCHRPHSAPRPARLLASAQERAVCLGCHDGTVAAKNVEAELSKASAHPVAASDWTHDPTEDPAGMPRHVTCADCHEPHQASAGGGAAPAVPGPLRGARGVSVAGATVADVTAEYEVCLKCHGLRDEAATGIVRQDATRNVRLRIATGNASYHPVAAVGKNTAVTGFEPGWSASSFVSCTDCHDSDEWTPGGARPRGPHGSRYAPILARNYDVDGPAAESPQAYALCYKCHARALLLGDRARTFPHARHVVNGRAPCAACHDAHGSRRAPGLVDFMLRDRTGRTVVSPSRTQGRLEYLPLGPGRGQCFLTCHGRSHEPSSYP